MCAAIVLAVTGAVIAVVQSDYRASSGPELGKEFTYDLSALRNIEPSLIDYVEGAPIQTGFQVVHAIATGPSDRIYVGGDSGVRVFGVDGKRALEFKLDAAAACLVVSSDGTIYVGINDHVELFDAKGARKARWSAAAAKSQLTSIAVSKSGVFVADWNERIVLHYDTKGTLLARIGAKSQSTKAPGFIVPSPYFDVAVSPKGMLLVADTGRHQLESYSADGQFKSAWGKFTPEVEGFCGCCNPAHFALLPDGRFVTTEKGLLRVKTYAVDGTFQSVVAPPAVFPDQPLECQDDCHKGIALPVAADSRGRVLVLDPVAKNVRVFVMKAKEVNDDPF
ncbi:MAG TPA: hypothetical protein VKX17_20310 [Planctomycetota bacterium]|nr:hypothetical protein [Planctomycetota bacterium]